MTETRDVLIWHKNPAKAVIHANGGVSIHTLRYCHATHALRHGKAPIDLVAATLGHASAATTGRHLPSQRTARRGF